MRHALQVIYEFTRGIRKGNNCVTGVEFDFHFVKEQTRLLVEHIKTKVDPSLRVLYVTAAERNIEPRSLHEKFILLGHVCELLCKERLILEVVHLIPPNPYFRSSAELLVEFSAVRDHSNSQTERSIFHLKGA